MGGKNDSAPPPPQPIDANQSMGEFLFGSAWQQGQGITDPDLQQRLIEAEAVFGPQYLENALRIQEGSLFGVGGQQGLLDLYREAAPITEEMRAETTTAQREADLGDVEALGLRATEALRASDPERAALIDQQRELTDTLFGRAYRVTPEQARMAQQSAREGGAARGREMDNLTLFSEALGREEFLRQNRMEAQQAGNTLFGYLQSSSADPFQAILGRPAGALPYNQAAAQSALGLAGQASPQLFNPDAGVNLALQNNQNLANYNAATYGAQQARQGSLFGGLFGGAGSAIGGIFG